MNEDKQTIVAGMLSDEKYIKMHEQSRRVYEPDGIAPTIHTCGGGNQEPKIIEPILFDGFNGRIRKDQETVGSLTQSCKQADSRNGIAIIECPLLEPDVIQKPRGNNDGGITGKETCPTITKSAFEQNVLIGVVEPTAYDEQNQYARADGCIGTLTTDGSSPKHNNRVIEPSYRIRKLTPKECWRLMGFTDEDFDRAKWLSKEKSEEILAKYKHKGKRKMSHDGRVERMSNNQLYKQAGNSIVVSVLEAIFRELIGKKESSQ